MPKRTPFGKGAISSTTHKPATNTMYMNANPTAATALWRVITTTYSSPVVSGTIYAVGNCRPLHRKVIGAKGSLTSRLYKKRSPLPKRPLSQRTPPALRATSPISAHLRAEEEVKASSFTKVKKNGTTCHTLQYCGISLSTKDGRPYILFTSIEFYQTAIEKF